MASKYVLAPRAALDLAEIWNYLRENASLAIADRVETTILDRVVLLARTPSIGHRRTDLTEENVRFFPVYSYLIVYRDNSNPLQIVTIIHGRRDVEAILKRNL